jgi:hypothetical protein
MEEQPWEMSMEEFREAVRRGVLHRVTGRGVPGEESTTTPLRMGELNGHTGDDIAHFYAVRRGYGVVSVEGYDSIAVGRAQLLLDALGEGRCVPEGVLRDLLNITNLAS